MGVVMVGGQARKVGKTSVVEGILAALPERRWTAVKVTQCHHAEPGCHCKLNGSAYALSEEMDQAAETDTSRYLRAGAERSFWMRVRAGETANVVPVLQSLAEKAEDLILESSSLAEYWKPDLFFCVMSATGVNEKPRWKHLLTLADAWIVPEQLPVLSVEEPLFVMTDPNFFGDLARFISSRIPAS